AGSAAADADGGELELRARLVAELVAAEDGDRAVGGQARGLVHGDRCWRPPGLGPLGAGAGEGKLDVLGRRDQVEDRDREQVAVAGRAIGGDARTDRVDDHLDDGRLGGQRAVVADDPWPELDVVATLDREGAVAEDDGAAGLEGAPHAAAEVPRPLE